jgi:hypothetical protein
MNHIRFPDKVIKELEDYTITKLNNTFRYRNISGNIWFNVRGLRKLSNANSSNSLNNDQSTKQTNRSNWSNTQTTKGNNHKTTQELKKRTELGIKYQPEEETYHKTDNLSAMTTLKTWKIWSPKKFKTGQ